MTVFGPKDWGCDTSFCCERQKVDVDNSSKKKTTYNKCDICGSEVYGEYQLIGRSCPAGGGYADMFCPKCGDLNYRIHIMQK